MTFSITRIINLKHLLRWHYILITAYAHRDGTWTAKPFGDIRVVVTDGYAARPVLWTDLMVGTARIDISGPEGDRYAND